MNFTKCLVSTAALFALSLPTTAIAQCDSSKKVSQRDSAKTDIVSTAVAAGSFKTLAAALKAADLIGALQADGPFTVFAPTDAAFAKLPAGTVENLLKPENKGALTAILTYHVVAETLDAKHVTGRSSLGSLQGQRIPVSTEHGVRVGTANVVKADIWCTNGVIHVIDSVILPSTDSILTTAAKAGSFKTLAAAIGAAGLAEALSGPGPFTVFAPTDAAFAKLPEGTIATLLKPENKAKLVQILKLHVVSGRVYSDQALKAGSAKTLEGSTLTIGVEGGVARVGASKLIKTDIQAANGVIHVIDEVLLPQTRVSQAPIRSERTWY
jgi:uncharacterized surface protein with fasciclin (FAS1) repeats